jgi:predicted tellurium resistance membrane protein TerC
MPESNQTLTYLAQLDLMPYAQTVIAWIMRLDQTLFTVAGIALTGKGLILLAGGLFLIYKATKETCHKAELDQDDQLQNAVAALSLDMGKQVSQA